MLEVCRRFPAIGTIPKYKALSLGERILYNQYVVWMLEIEAKQPKCALFGKKASVKLWRTLRTYITSVKMTQR